MNEQTLEIGGVTYKISEEWIRENCPLFFNSMYGPDEEYREALLRKTFLAQLINN